MRVSAEQVRAIMDRPPYWLSGSYLAGYRDGRVSVEVLALGVVVLLVPRPPQAGSGLQARAGVLGFVACFGSPG